MRYRLEGTFIEACDCYVVCPCWVDDDPDEGHCTGLFAWSLASTSFVSGIDVGGRTVVAVTTHQGRRRVAADEEEGPEEGAAEGTAAAARSATVLFVDEGADDRAFEALTTAFAGKMGGPLADLADVSGQVLGTHRAHITVEPNRGRDRGDWTVRVTALGPNRAPVEPGVEFVRATGGPRYLEKDPTVEPLTLSWTALSKELGIKGEPVEAQLGQELSLHVGELPGAYLELSGRSGMRGRFSYREPNEQGGPDPDRDDEPAAAVED